MGSTKQLQKLKNNFIGLANARIYNNGMKSVLSVLPGRTPLVNIASLGTVSAAYPFQVIALDILGPPPTTKIGSKYVLVIGDYFSKWTEAFPIIDMETKTVAKVLIDEFICRFGTPKQGMLLCQKCLSNMGCTFWKLLQHCVI